MLGQAVLALLGFLLVRHVFRGLGGDALGLFYSALALHALLTAATEIGLSSTVVRELSARLQDGDRTEARDLVRTASLFYWSAFAVLAMGTWLAAPVLARYWFRLEELEAAAATRSLRLLGLGAALAVPRALYSSLFRGLQRMKTTALIEMSSAAVQLAGGLWTVRSGAGLLGLSTWWAATCVLPVAAGAAAASRHLPRGALVPGWSAGVLRGTRRFTSQMLGVAALSLVQSHLDRILVSALLPARALGYYGFGYSAVSKGALLAGAVAQVALPAFSASLAAGRRDELVGRFWRLQGLVSFATLPIFAATPFITSPVLGYMFEPAVAATLVLPLTLVAAGFYLNGTLQVPLAFCLAAGGSHIPLALNLYALAVMPPLAFLLVSRLGLAGAGLAWVCYHGLAYVYAVPRMWRRCLGAPLRPWLERMIPAWLAAVAIYGVAWLAAGGHAARDGHLALSYLLATVVFLAVAWRVMGHDLRQAVAEVRGYLRPRGADRLRAAPSTGQREA